MTRPLLALSVWLKLSGTMRNSQGVKTYATWFQLNDPLLVCVDYKEFNLNWPFRQAMRIQSVVLCKPQVWHGDQAGKDFMARRSI